MGEDKRKKKRAPMGLGSWIVLLLCGIVFCGSAAYLGLYAKDKVESEKDFENLLAEVEDMGLEGAWEKNSDTVGWIEIEGTKINYPVMQTPEDPEYYLRRDFEEEYSESGTPFLDGESRIGKGAGSYNDGNGTWNWLIYGHNMKFGTMFHDLLEYDSRDFWEEHSTFTFEDIVSVKDGKVVTEKGEYEIVAACRSRIKEKDSNEFKYYRYPGYMDRETFDDFVAGIKKESLYDTGIEPEYGDQLVTVSTCAYHTEEGRFYIVGRQSR